MSFFKQDRKGGKCGAGEKTGGGISGLNSGKYIIDVSYKIPGAGEQAGYDQNVVKRSGSKL